jgi:hypothetical protein
MHIYCGDVNAGPQSYPGGRETMQTAAVLVMVGLVGLAAAVDIQVRLAGLKGVSQENESGLM